MPRIIGGAARGRRLAVPTGTVTRPTTDKVREALFNVLAHRIDAEIAGARVLDLFAGAGTLGLEALSRGAAEAVFVESEARVARVLGANLQCVPGGRLVRRTVAGFLAEAPSAAFDLVFLDPPYARGHVAPTLAALGPWLAPEAVICVDHDPSEAVIPPEGLTCAFERRYGASMISILCPPDPDSLTEEP